MRYSARVIALRRLTLVAVMASVVLAAVGAPRALASGNDASRVRDARAHYEQAVAHYNLDEFPQALAEFREAYRLKPDPSFLFNIAQCHRKLGDVDAALDFYRKYLRSLPEATNRADVERLIAELRAKQASPSPPAPAAESAPPPVVAPPPAPVAPVPPAAAPAPAATSDALVVTAPPPAAAPVYKRWWFWTAVGVVLAGAAVGAYAATRPGPQPYQGTLDPHVTEVP